MSKGCKLGVQVGGVQTVTLGDEEARARGTQKSVLERKAPPTFPILIEMRERSHWVAHQVINQFCCVHWTSFLENPLQPSFGCLNGARLTLARIWD